MKIIMHMPHVSLRVPKSFYKGLLIDRNLFNKYNLLMSDLGVDELFKEYKYIKIKPKYSRLYCDVERFKDDNLEIMSKYGQGVIYTNTYDGLLFHHNSDDYKKKVYRYYDKYHKRLDRITKRLLKHDDTLLILDIHSYSDTLASKISEPPFPDICIGVEDNYYDKDILDIIINKIKKLGYSYKINYPYKGSLVPNIIYNNIIKGKVISIMIEINKRIYLY